MVLAQKPIKTFSKQRLTMSMNKKKAEERLRASEQEINDLVSLFNLNDDARAKLEVVPLKVFKVVQETFAPPAGCDNNSGMVIGFAASICKRMGFQQKENRPGKRMPPVQEPKHDFNGGAPMSRTTKPRSMGKGASKGAGATSDVTAFVQNWGLYPKCTQQINALSRNLRSFVLKHFRSDSAHESQINSQFQEFVKDLNALELRVTSTRVESYPHYPEDDIERPDSAHVDDFCMLYNLNADARGKLDQLSSKSLETVMQEFVLPDGVTECNGILINFANSVEKKLTGKGKGRGGKGRKRMRN